VQATTIQGTGSGAVFEVKVDAAGVRTPVLLIGGYGYTAGGTPSILKLFKESFGSHAAGDITVTVTGLLASSPGLSAVMVTSPCTSPIDPCRNAVPTSVGDGTYTGA
jgi:hypothetical protein